MFCANLKAETTSVLMGSASAAIRATESTPDVSSSVAPSRKAGVSPGVGGVPSPSSFGGEHSSNASYPLSLYVSGEIGFKVVTSSQPLMDAMSSLLIGRRVAKTASRVFGNKRGLTRIAGRSSLPSPIQAPNPSRNPSNLATPNRASSSSTSRVETQV